MEIKAGELILLDNGKKLFVLEDGHSDTPFSHILVSFDEMTTISYIDGINNALSLIEDELLLGNVKEVKPLQM